MAEELDGKAQQQDPAEPPEAAPAADDGGKGAPDPAKAAEHYKEQRDKAREAEKTANEALEALQKRVKDLEGKPIEVEELKKQLEAEKEAHTKEAAELESKRVNTVRLTQAGCIDPDVALSLLNEHGDVDKLKEEKPYLFDAKPKGSTGAKPTGATDGIDALIDKAFARK